MWALKFPPSLSTMVKFNFEDAFKKVPCDLDRWNSLPNSLRAHVSDIKINIKPQINFMSSVLTQKLAAWLRFGDLQDYL